MLDVFDENVLVVANDLSRISAGLEPISDGTSDDCRVKCAERLMKAIRTGKVVLDAGSEYFDKYRAHCSMQGQPGVGDAFVRLVYERGYTDWAQRVEIRTGDGTIRLPPEITGSGFDNDDYLWIAGALNCPKKACVVNAVDADYHEHAELLNNNGLIVDQLCSNEACRD